MPKRIQEDHKKFRDVISGRSRKQLKKLIKSGAIVRQRPKGGKVSISIPQIDIPRFVFGDTGEGVGRGPGKDGDVIRRDPKPGQPGPGAGDDSAEGIQIQIDMDDVLKFMEDELRLPQMKPKPSETFEEVKVKYNNISRVGLNSLRHIRRTMKEAIKRRAMMGDLEDMQMVPGSDVPIKVITPIKSDFRFRQYKEIKIPSSNAVILFARDCSGSMDDYRCDIVSDMSWWIDCWIKKFYKKVERCYFVHDTRAEEVDEQTFYKYRMGGGTMCSSAFDKIAEQFENRYPPDKFNIYVFYFTDGDNWGDDNEKVVTAIKEKFGAAVNLTAITQICSYSYDSSVKQHIDDAVKAGDLNKDQVKTASIGEGKGASMTEEERNSQIIDAIRKILSPAETRSKHYEDDDDL